jgi:ribosomal protein S18 acetylase RimI-like enzyme
VPSLSSAFTIRPAHSRDVGHVADILTESFYRNYDHGDEHSDRAHGDRTHSDRRHGDRRHGDHKVNFWQRSLIDLVFPLLRYGIILDLGSRFDEKTPFYTCIVATHKTNQSQAIASLEICMRHVPTKPHPEFWLVRETQQYPYIFNLAVHPQWRRRGAAKQLLIAAEKIVKQWGFSRMYMHVLEDNQPARSLYDRLGYRLHSHEGNVSYWLLGRPRRFLLQKKLN